MNTLYSEAEYAEALQWINDAFRAGIRTDCGQDELPQIAAELTQFASAPKEDLL